MLRKFSELFIGDIFTHKIKRMILCMRKVSENQAEDTITGTRYDISPETIVDVL